jgi:formylglycine-generating enzyme required for sulfatase activity
MNPETARRLIEDERAAYPRVVDLARHLSLAVRIESELLRAMRLRVMSSVEAGVEADLYFSPLVQTRDVNAITLIPAVREHLHRELAQHKDELEAARTVIEAAHGEMDAVILLEEMVAYHALRDDQEAFHAMQRQLGSVIRELEKSDVDPGLVSWAADAFPRLPDRALNSQAGRVLTGLLSSNLTRMGLTPPAIETTAPVSGYAMSPVSLGFQATAGGVEICYPHRPGYTKVETLAADAVSLELAWPVPGGWESRMVELQDGEAVTTVPDVPLGLVRLRGINGDETKLRVDGPFTDLKPKLLGLHRGIKKEVPAFIEDELSDLSWQQQWLPLRTHDEPLVFISAPHRSERTAPLIDELKRLLHSMGMRTWLPPENFSSNVDWNSEVSRVLSACQSAVVVLSPETSPENEWLFHELSLLAFRKESDADFSLHLVLAGGLDPETATSLLSGMDLPGLFQGRMWQEMPELVAKAISDETSTDDLSAEAFSAAVVSFPDSKGLENYMDEIASGKASLMQPLDSLIMAGKPVLIYAGETYQGQTSQGVLKVSRAMSESLLNEAVQRAARLGFEQRIEPSGQNGSDRHQLLRRTLLDAEHGAVTEWLKQKPGETTLQEPPPDTQDDRYWKIIDDGKEGHKGTVRSIAISADGVLALTAGNSHPDQTIKLWDLNNRRLIRTYEEFAQAGGWTPMAIAPDKSSAITGYGGELRIIDLKSGESSALMLTEAPLTALAFIDAERYLVGAADGSLLLVNRSGVELDIPYSREEVVRLAVSGDRVVCLRGSSLEQLDLKKGSPIHQIMLGSAESGLHWQRTPLYIDEAADRILFGTPLRVLDMGTGKVTSLTDSSQLFVEVLGSWLVRYDGKSEFSIADDISALPFATITIAPEQPACLALADNGRRLIIADYEHNLHVYDLAPALGATESEAEDVLDASSLDLLASAQKAAEMWRSEGYTPDLVWEPQRLDSLRAMLQNNPEHKTQLLQEFAQPAPRLLQRLEDQTLNGEERNAIGDLLAAIGDPRPGVGLNEEGLPDIDWVEIPAGEFIYGEGKEQEKIFLDTYYIGRYPVTNAQFQAFIDAGGYQVEDWWQGIRLMSPEEPSWREANRPRETISWFEAIAFCRWLSHEQGVEIRLPTEQEWEKAARGTDGREYPWGNGYRAGAANVVEKESETGRSGGFGHTCAVGLYPQGASPYGVFDMTGNVFQWCMNKADSQASVEVDASQVARAWRGGALDAASDFVRPALRLANPPDDQDRSGGFRVLCVSPFSNR